jgi:hypothetical protein
VEARQSKRPFHFRNKKIVVNRSHASGLLSVLRPAARVITWKIFDLRFAGIFRIVAGTVSLTAAIGEA